jgi:hypothetical protein
LACEQIAQQVRVVSLDNNEQFTEQFMENIYFPRQNTKGEPNVN